MQPQIGYNPQVKSHYGAEGGEKLEQCCFQNESPSQSLLQGILLRNRVLYYLVL